MLVLSGSMWGCIITLRQRIGPRGAEYEELVRKRLEDKRTITKTIRSKTWNNERNMQQQQFGVRQKGTWL